MYIELYDKYLNHITNIQVIKMTTPLRTYDPSDGDFLGKCSQNIDQAIMYVIRDKQREPGYRYHAGFIKNIKYPTAKSVSFKGDDLRKVFDIDILIDWSNETADLTVHGIFQKVADLIMNSKDSMINNIPIYFDIPVDTTSTKFIADYSHRYIIANATKFQKVYLGYFGYSIHPTYNQELKRIEFVYRKQTDVVSINISDFIHEKTSSDIKTNKTIATISYSTVEEVKTEWLESNIDEYSGAISKSTVVGEGVLPELPNPDVYENNYVLRRVENKQYVPGNSTGYNASEFQATRYVLTTPRTSCPSTPPNGTQVWDLIQTEPFNDLLYYRVAYKYIHSTTGIMTYCSNWQYGQIGVLGAVDYHKKTGSTYYPRPDLPEHVYTLGSDNLIYDGYAPADKRIYPVQQKIFESGNLADAQLNAVYELVNSRYVENIILTDDKVMSPIPLDELELNTLIRAYDVNGDYKELPISEKVISHDSNGSKVEIKLGFKKTKFTEIIKNEIGVPDRIILSGGKGTSGTPGDSSYLHIAYANLGVSPWTDFSKIDSVNKLYIGQYTDGLPDSSDDPSKYLWSLFKGADGSNGADGTDGATGPGLIYVGAWGNSVAYVRDAIRQDVVYSAAYGNYYACKVSNTNVVVTDTNYWTVMTGFKSIATDILLAQNAAITKGLVMGSAAEKGFIRSYDMTALNSGNGFYLAGDGQFIFGNYNGNKVSWDGTNLVIVDSPIKVDLLSENSLTAIFRIYNRTSLARTLYVSNTNYLVAESFVSSGTISANSYLDVTLSIGLGNKNRIAFYLSGFTSNKVTHYVINPTVAYQSTTTVSISGGTSVSHHYYDVTYQNLSSSTPITYRVYQGVLDITSALGTATITVSPSLNDPVILATINSENSDGSGVDTVYTYAASNTYTGTFKITHDYSSSTNYKRVSYRIMGYING